MHLENIQRSFKSFKFLSLSLSLPLPPLSVEHLSSKAFNKIILQIFNFYLTKNHKYRKLHFVYLCKILFLCKDRKRNGGGSKMEQIGSK